ncbi:exonuclease domain-containing protein [Autumnicola edwardsiae]|uniref:Exonuclease domain-containing protein n=1 Tax=Autumnicola edwardsiae TaxID=3075594 RepID=A0ABU3CS67_9FLAO|nr:exonuclease domain-containing protein [Zunongwangia sp. F297]MDT0649193.1 exonuclease domain-containing protein [Zunongwangia sp. F297]
MKDRKFAVIDVETTGGGISGNRLTEICIVLLQGSEILDKYTTLINPEKIIPNYITSLTGIDNELLEDAPKFHEVADAIEEFTKGAVFVAHNVNFDYNVLRNEFKALGRNFTRKKLCTVRLSRKLIPGLFSYSLGKLCSSINIPLNNRHRAEGDTDATVILFQRLLDLDEGGEVLSSFLHPHSKNATLPPHLSAEQIEDLPETPGIYLFKDKQHEIIYAGKAKNIKKRVWSHFYDKKTKEYQLGQETSYIDFETTGNELLALLLESDYIRKKYPKFNRAQKRPTYTYQIINYRNQRGIIQLAIGRTKQIHDSAATFYNRALAQEMLEKLCENFNLCPKYCTLQSNVSQCSHYRIRNCEGVCDGSESVEDYNAKVEAAITSLKNEKETYVIKEKGRHKDEQAFVLIKEGRYYGYGFVDAEVQIQNFHDYEPFLKLQESTFHTHQIISSYLRKKGTDNVIRFNEVLMAG